MGTPPTLPGRLRQPFPLGFCLLRLVSFWAGLAVSFGSFYRQCHMQIDVRSEADLDRYDQLFTNPVLDLLFGVANGSAVFLQFFDSSSTRCFRTTCFAVLLEVRDFQELQDAIAHPQRVPDPPLAWTTPRPAEDDRGTES